MELAGWLEWNHDGIKSVRVQVDEPAGIPVGLMPAQPGMVALEGLNHVRDRLHLR